MKIIRCKISSILLLAPLSIFAAISQRQLERPNVILILEDDLGYGDLNCYGIHEVKTTVIDPLANEGIHFTDAHTTSCVNTPSRYSLLTGRYCWRTILKKGDIANGPALIEPGRTTLASIFKEKGYKTAIFGKWHMGHTNEKEVYYNEAVKLFDEADTYDRNDKYIDRSGYFYKAIGQDIVHLTRFTGYQAKEFISNAPTNKPFCLSLYFSALHVQDSSPDLYFWQAKSNNQYADLTIPPPALGDVRHFNALPKEVRDGFNRTCWYWRYDTPEKYQHSMKGYYRMISKVDDEIEELGQVLKEKGIAGNTIIIFMGDHGYFEGERQLAGKWLMYDLSIRVLMIIYDPRVKKHQDVSDMVLNIDIPKTILSLSSFKIPEPYQGVSLLPHIEGNKPEHKRKAI